jgi:flavin reductase (DIM6/NTAB) family NADH-FMN oxidoreductase RutF
MVEASGHCAPALAPEQLRAAFGGFATGVTVVTTADAAGQPAGMTVNSFSAVSLQPPLVLWCAQRGVPPFDAFATATHYAVHVLAVEQRALSDLFADPATLRERFAGLPLERGVAGLPLIPGCPTRLQCVVAQRHEAGDHLILVGRVLAVEHRQAPPLLFHGGQYLLR